MRFLLSVVFALTCSASWASTRSPAFLTTQSASASVTVPGIFVDSVGGSDGNTGSSNAPYASLAKVTSVLSGSTAATNIYLKRGSTFREAWAVPTNSTVDCYGTVTNIPAIYGGIANSKPVITGAEWLTNSNFTLLAGKTNCWAYSIDVPVFTNSYASLVTSNVLMVWENNVRLGAMWASNSGVGGTNAVEGGTNRFFYDTAAKVLYISTSDFSDPATNGRTYEASVRTLALHGGSNVFVSNIIGEKCYSYDGSSAGQGIPIYAQHGGTYSKCVGRYGYLHLIGVGNSYVSPTLIFDSCYALDMERAGTAYVAYKDNTNGPSLVIFTNCLASQSTINKGIGSGYYAHDLGGVNKGVTTRYVKSVAQWFATGFSDYGGGRTLEISDDTAVACSSAGVDIGSSIPLTRFTNYYPTLTTARGVQISSALTVPITDSKFIFTNNATGIGTSSATADIRTTNCIFAATGTRAGYAFQGTGGWTGTQWHSVSNIFSNVSIGFLNGSMAADTDYNDYYTMQYIGDLEGGGGIPSPGYWTGAQFSTWKSAWAGVGVTIDVNSYQTDPGYAAGFYTFTPTDPTGGDGN